jgi:hypothetical protein
VETRRDAAHWKLQTYRSGDRWNMIRNSLGKAACASVLALALVSAGGMSAFAQSQPAPAPQPGQPAGQQARETSRGEVAIWLWPLAGLAVIGGVVAAAGGGGGGGGGGTTSPAGTN